MGKLILARHHESELAPQVRVGILVHRDVRDVAELDSGLAQAIADRLGRKTGPVLDTTKAFFLDRREQLSIL